MKLFLPQTTLEEWAGAEKADLKDGKLVVAETREGHAVTPAVHFRQIVSGNDDKKLLGKVKTHEQLDALGAEHMADSVILGEAAYEVTEGYVAEVAQPPAQAKPPQGPPAKKQGSAETDLLAEFLLGKL